VGSSDGRVFTVNIENPTISSDILTSNRQNNMMVTPTGCDKKSLCRYIGVYTGGGE